MELGKYECIYIVCDHIKQYVISVAVHERTLIVSVTKGKEALQFCEQK